MNINKLREYIVIINGGSGCIFQPMTKDYSYILTAKHNIEDYNNTIDILIRFEFVDGNWNKINIPYSELVIGENYFPHADKDICIIKIDKLNNLEQIIRVDNLDEDRFLYFLMGYPETRREANIENEVLWFRPDENVTINHITQNQLREARVPDTPGYEEIAGHSGGCLVKGKGNYFLLAGIQNKMVDAGVESLGRIEFSTMISFDEIVESYPNALSPMYPAYLKCFSFLKDDCFDLKAGLSQENINFTKGFLRHQTEKIISSSATPMTIKNFFSKRLLIDKQSEDILLTKKIWIIWLEFLTILNIIKYDNFSGDELPEIFDSIRLIYSDTEEDWATEIKNIVYSDFKGLPKDGIVIVGMSKPPEDETFIINKTIPMIAHAKKNQDRDRLKIDAGINFPFDDFKFVHIDYFKGKSIIKKHAEYSSLDDDATLLQKLKEEYTKFYGEQ